MNELDFSELESVSGGIQLGGLAAVQQPAATGVGLGLDPFTQQFGYPTFFPGSGLGPGIPGSGLGYGIPGLGYALDNGGCGGFSGGHCNPCVPDFGQLGVGYGYGYPGGQLGVGPYGFFPGGGQVAAGSQPIVAPTGSLTVGPTFGGPVTAGGTLSVGPIGSPLGFPL